MYCPVPFLGFFFFGLSFPHHLFFFFDTPHRRGNCQRHPVFPAAFLKSFSLLFCQQTCESFSPPSFRAQLAPVFLGPPLPRTPPFFRSSLRRSYRPQTASDFPSPLWHSHLPIANLPSSFLRRRLDTFLPPTPRADAEQNFPNLSSPRKTSFPATLPTPHAPAV